MSGKHDQQDGGDPLSVSGVGSGGLAVGDRNADRPADIVLANNQTNQVSIYLSKK
jgi:hypothetical protein